MKLSVAEDRADPLFVFYYLRSRYGQNQLLSATSQTGVPAIASPTATLKNITIPLPPIKEQQAIACILGTLDDKIELNRQMNQTLEGLARAIFKSWFVDFDPVRAKAEDRDPGLAAQLAELFSSSLVTSELGDIPEGWVVSTVSAIASICKEPLKPSDSPETKWEHYSIPAFDSGRAPAHELGSMIKSTKLRVPSDCVLVSKLNPQLPRVWHPNVQNTEAAVCSTEFIPFVPKKAHQRSFLYELMKSHTVQREIANGASGTTGSRQRVKAEDVASIPVVEPPDGLVHEFSQLVNPMQEKIGHATTESHTLGTIRDTLLPKLISGKLRVRDAEAVAGRCP
jgi:type I restriction enzyme S subunit